MAHPLPSRTRSGRPFGVLLTAAVLISLLFSPFVSSPAYAIGRPTPQAPADNAQITATGEGGSIAAPPVAVPEFRWTAVSGAKAYRLQLSQDIAFTDKTEFTTPYRHLTPTDISRINDGTWYWRVRVDSPEVSEYSETFVFNRVWASPENRPVLNEPVDGATLEFFDAPVFAWQPVLGAAQYRFQISTSPDFSASTIIYNQLTLATTIQPQTKPVNGTSYYWRVIPIDAANREGTISEARLFNLAYNQIPQLLSPADNSFPTFTPTFRWTAVRGASVYRLQYSTDPSFNTNVTFIDTRNTTYTPKATLPNDVNYYWRVRASSGASVSDWSEIWTFRKQWYIQPVPLTPVNNYQQARIPAFSWSPVPGASYYKFELDTDIGFTDPIYEISYTGNPFYNPRKYEGVNQVWYWRVTPYDNEKFAGRTSNVFSYRSSYDLNSPGLVYPLYYYIPNNFPAPNQAVAMSPHEDRTVPLPIFMWHRVSVPAPTGGTFANAYRLQVSQDPLFFTVDWSVDTENLAATPLRSDNFTPAKNVDYYWRVCPLDSIGGSCRQNPGNGAPWWSQVWKTRIDLSAGLAKTNDSNKPKLLRPVSRSESVETTPLLEWWPYKDSGGNEADAYDVQISSDSNFDPGYTVASDIVTYPAYIPTVSLAERMLSRLDYGDYFWRVRARKGGAPLGSWSATWRFQIASQSEWTKDRTIGNASNRLQIAADPDDTANNDFELTTLYASQSKDYWFFGFDVAASTNNMIYALYIDLDRLENSGADSDARGFTVTTVPYHRPEYAIYIIKSAGNFSADGVGVYAWGGNSWGAPDALSSIGGELHFNAGYLEIKVPNTAIGMQEETGSASLSLFSLPSLSGQPVDSVPSDETIPGSGPISRFTSVSEKMILRTPPNAGNDPSVFPSVLPFFWEYPTGSTPASPWAGSRMNVYLDPQFTNQIATFIVESTSPYYASDSHAWPDDLKGDNTYYWRIQPRYRVSNLYYFGSWSQGWRFERQGFIPQNLDESVTLATPTFSWDIVEGARSYDLQVDNDPNFGTPDISILTAQTSYTPPETLANGTYYWRVRARRYTTTSDIINEWSPARSFTLTLPLPQNLTPDDPGEAQVVNRAPTLCWDPLIALDQGKAILAAYKYRVQVSKGDPTFSTIYDTTDTEQSCWTPMKGYADSKYFWRVAMIDGQGRLGGFSATAEFTKQYPVTKLVSPLGDTVPDPPTFVWTSVNGAARYKLEISLSETFSPIFDTATTHTIRYTSTKTYEGGTTYYWRVAIIDKDGNYGPFTDATIYQAANKMFVPINVND